VTGRMTFLKDEQYIFPKCVGYISQDTAGFYKLYSQKGYNALNPLRSKVKSSGVRQSKIYKTLLELKGLREIVFLTL